MARTVICTDTVELTVPSKPEYVRSVRMIAEQMAQSIPLSKASIDDLKVAVSEAVANVVRHAYSGECSVMPVDVVITRNEREIVVEVSDNGVGFNLPPDEHKLVPDLSKEGGLGIILIRELMDGVVYWSKPGCGTRIRMSKSAKGYDAATARSRATHGAQLEPPAPSLV